MLYFSFLFPYNSVKVINKFVYSRLRLGSPPKSQDAINLGFDSCLMYNVENWTEIYMVSKIGSLHNLYLNCYSIIRSATFRENVIFLAAILDRCINFGIDYCVGIVNIFFICASSI